MKLLQFDGRKAIDVWNSDGDMWNYLTGAPPEQVKDFELYSKVAAARRAVRYIANVLASIPFVLTDERGEIYDDSAAWENKVGFLPNPTTLMSRVAESVVMTNSAYLFREKKGRRDTALRYIAPQTMSADADDTGIRGFYRQLGTSRRYYRVDERVIVYLFSLDYTTELLPTDATLFRAMTSAAGVLHASDFWINHYIGRGGVKPFIASVKGIPNAAEKEKAEDVLSRLARNAYKYVAKLINGEAMDIKVVGDGLEVFQSSPIYDQAIRNICIATGIPEDELLNNAANYATAQVHAASFYRNTISPLINMLSEGLNDQLWKDYGLTMRPQIERTEPNSQEEAEKVAAAKILADMLLLGNYREDPIKAAVETLGIDMPEWWTWEKAPAPEPAPAPMPAPVADVEEIDEPEEPDEDDDMDEQPAVRSFTFDQVTELTNWHALAQRKLKRGEPLAFEWKSETLPGELVEQIAAAIASAESDTAIKAIFDGAMKAEPQEVKPEPQPAPDNSAAIFALAEAINRAAEQPETKAEPTMPGLTINLTAQMPAVDAPAITVNVPEQPAPVVNVAAPSVTVEPAQITNEVTVQPAPVSVTPAPRGEVEVVRNPSGVITGLKPKGR